MLFKKIALAMPIVMLFAVSMLWSQAGRGILTGSVTDSQGHTLQGALITIDPGNVTAVSDPQGLFTLTALSSGEYSVTVTYVGFTTFTQKVTLTAGQSERVTASLQVATNNQEVQVYAGRQGGEVEAINRTFTADNIINVLPADVITSLPNANVADAIGRLPGVTLERDEGEGKYVQIRGTEPRLTHTTLDGISIASPESGRQIKLDLIPADLVESVQINKTLQADMEGDGIGGSVDLRTRSAGDRPTVALESSGGYTPIIGGRGEYQFDGTIGRRFLEGGKLGILFGGSYDWNGRGINDVEPGPGVTGTYDLRDYQYYRDRRGFAGTVDYRFSDTSNIFLKGLYSHFNNFGSDWIYTPAINNFIAPNQGDATGSVKFQALKRRPVQDIGGMQLGGTHTIRRSLFAWDINSSVGRTRDAGYSFARFGPSASTNPLNNIVYALDLAHPLTPQLRVQNGINIFDPTHLFYSGQTVQYYYSPEVDLGFGGSVATPYNLAGHASTFEVGGRFRNEHKFVNQDTRAFSPTSANAEDPSLAMTNFLNDFTDPHYYGGAYKFGPAVDYAKVTAFAGQTDTGPDSIGNSFNQLEKVSAGYLMNTTNFRRFRLVVGIRIEGTQENNLGYVAPKRGSTAANGTPVRNTGSYVNVLPSGSLRYSLTPASGIRLVYGRGLSRPNFSDLVPFGTVSSSGGAVTSVSLGNPKLRAEYADNVDLLYENNLPGTGLLQAGFFYKNLIDPILGTRTKLPANDPRYPGAFLNQTINAGSAYLYGVEIAFQQHFTYLPGLLDGLGLSTNYGYTNSQATLPPYIATPAVGQISGPNRGVAGSKPPLLRQSPNTYNFSPTYDKRGLSLRLGMTYNQANIASYGYDDSNSGPLSLDGTSGGGLRGPNGDTYFYSHLQLDLQGTYQLPKGFTAVAYALNMNNEVFGFYQGSTNYPSQREFYKQTYGGGIRWSPAREGRSKP